MSRVSKAYATAYMLDRVQVTKGQRGQKREFTVDFNGAIPVGQELASVTWRANYPWSAIMGTPTIGTNGRVTSVPVTFGYGGYSGLKCEATLDNGDVFTQVFEVTIVDWPWFNEPFPSVAGPFSVTISA